MKLAAFIPARGGSKRLPGKNLRKVGGHCLYDHACAVGIPFAEEVWLSTDHGPMQYVSEQIGLRVHRRPAHLATDSAQIEDAIAHWLPQVDCDAVLMLQPTSPLRKPEHVEEAVRMIKSGDWDTVVSVTPFTPFTGRVVGREFCRDHPLDYRPRSQERVDRCYENGAIYAFTREHFEKTGSRLGGRMGAVVMDRLSSIEIDDAEDLELARLVWEVRHG